MKRPTTDTLAKAILTFAVRPIVMAASAVAALLDAWLVMLAAGALHRVWPSVPALGFSTTWLGLMGFGILLGAYRTSAALTAEHAVDGYRAEQNRRCA